MHAPPIYLAQSPPSPSTLVLLSRFLPYSVIHTAALGSQRHHIISDHQAGCSKHNRFSLGFSQVFYNIQKLQTEIIFAFS